MAITFKTLLFGDTVEWARIELKGNQDSTISLKISK